MSQPIPRAVSGFYPRPIPVSLSDQAVVFLCGEALYRVDSRLHAAALLLNRIPLEGGPPVWQVIGGAEIEAALGGNTRFSYFDIHADHTRLRAHRGRAFIEVKMCDLNGPYPRHLLLQVNEDGAIVLWRDKLLLDLDSSGRPMAYPIQFNPTSYRRRRVAAHRLGRGSPLNRRTEP